MNKLSIKAPESFSGYRAENGACFSTYEEAYAENAEIQLRILLEFFSAKDRSVIRMFLTANGRKLVAILDTFIELENQRKLKQEKVNE